MNYRIHGPAHRRSQLRSSRPEGSSSALGYQRHPALHLRASPAHYRRMWPPQACCLSSATSAAHKPWDPAHSRPLSHWPDSRDRRLSGPNRSGRFRWRTPSCLPDSIVRQSGIRMPLPARLTGREHRGHAFWPSAARGPPAGAGT